MKGDEVSSHQPACEGWLGCLAQFGTPLFKAGNADTANLLETIAIDCADAWIGVKHSISSVACGRTA
jgi:hypothetical protein